MKQKSKNQNQKKKKQSNLSDYAKYSTLAFQMIAIILIGVFGGIKLDEIVPLEFPLFTVLFTILSVLLSMYYAIKDLIRFK